MAYNYNLNPTSVPQQNQIQQQAQPQMMFQQQNVQPLFPQPQGNVYNINSTLEVANVPVGAGTTTYPLLNCDCTNVSACQITPRTRYSVRVHTNIQSGIFKLLGPAKCNLCNRSAAALPITTTTTTETEEG